MCGKCHEESVEIALHLQSGLVNWGMRSHYFPDNKHSPLVEDYGSCEAPTVVVDGANLWLRAILF